MSRVDEALRRARAAAGSEVETAAVVDAAALAPEPLFDLPLEQESAETSRPLPFTAKVPALPAPRPKAVEPPQPRRSVSRLLPALIERIDRALAEKVVVDAKMMSTSREQYRRLAGTLHHAQTANGLKVVMVVSAAPAEGKTLTAANLALTFSESYKRTVLLIDADLRRPALHQVFGTDNARGLTEGLTAPEESKLPVRQVSERLALLQAGQPNGDPMAGLTSERMRRVISEAREAFDWVIIDSPPVVLLPDANLLGAMVDGAVMVVKAGSTPYDLVQRAIEAIGRDRILGIVLNRAETAAHAYPYSSYSSYYGRPDVPGST